MSVKQDSAAPTLSPQAKILGFFLAGCLFMLVALAVAVISLPVSVIDTNGQAHILFTSDRRSVFQADDCVNLHWQVEGIREVYINNQPTVGQDETSFCPKPGAVDAALHIVFQDGTTHDYVITIALISRSPIFWFFTSIAGLFYIAAVASFITLELNSRFKSVLAALTRLIRLAERAALIIIIVGGFFELEARFYVTYFGTDSEKVRFTESAEDIMKHPSITLPMPYVNYVPSPDYPGHNRLGYRGPDIAIPKPQGTFRIVTLGGSTTYSSATTSEESYPAQLQKILREQYGYTNVEVINAGMIGYTSWDSLVNYMFRVTELEPDMLLIYDGVNDVEPRSVSPECYQGLNPLRGINPRRALYTPPKDQGISTLIRMFGVLTGTADDRATLTGNYSFVPYNCLGLARDDRRIAANPPVYFERNMRDIIILAQAYHTQVMFSTWAHSPDNQLPPEWITAFGENNAIIRNLADEYHLPFYDLEGNDFSKDTAHWAGTDPIHLSAYGTHDQASLYAAYIVKNGLIPKPGN